MVAGIFEAYIIKILKNGQKFRKASIKNNNKPLPPKKYKIANFIKQAMFLFGS